MTDRILTLFDGPSRIASGAEADILPAARAAMAAGRSPIAIDDDSGKVADLDLRSDPTAPLPEPRRRGRPKIGVTSKEVTLLPRHWDWLQSQTGGASATLRRLVEAASKADDPRARTDAAYRAATALAGDAPGYEDAIRALFAGDLAAMETRAAGWPPDVRDYVLGLARETP